MDSPFKKPAMSSGMNVQQIVNMLHSLPIEAQFLHHNTTSYAKHMATDMLYDGLNGLKDDVIEKIIGCTGSRYNAITVQPISGYSDEKCFQLAEKIKMFSKSLKSWAEQNEYLDIAQKADDMWGLGAKFSYLLTLS